jgi:hypothetical protein
MVDALNQSQTSVGGLPSYEDLERAVLGGAAAIHSLTTERDELRSRCEAQERELTILRATSDDLRRQLFWLGTATCALRTHALSNFSMSAARWSNQTVARWTQTC